MFFYKAKNTIQQSAKRNNHAIQQSDNQQNNHTIFFMQYNFQTGETLLVDKPKGWTSFDVVNKIRFRLRHITGVKRIKVGHAGTLDPMATGLLIICTGKFTKKLNEYQGLNKTYTGTLELGKTTPSYDAETEVDQEFPIEHITPELLHQNTSQFIGEIEQIPPIYSAIKVDGERLYKAARKGKKVEIKARQVRIDEFELTDIRMPHVDFRVSCAKGTYIRSLAYDFGKSVDSGAYLTALCRTHIGEFELEDAWNLKELIQFLENQPSKDKIC